MTRHRTTPLVLGLVLSCLGAPQARAADPLPTWNDGPARQAIVRFAAEVAKQGGPNFVPASERIATFDNDGTQFFPWENQ